MRWTYPTVLIAVLLMVNGVLRANDTGKAGSESAASRLSQKEIEEGFVSIFDGKTLSGWRGSTDGYVVENSVLICTKEKGRVDMTQTDFHKHFPQGGVGKKNQWLNEQLHKTFPDGDFRAIDFGAGKGGTVEWLNSLYPLAHIEPYEPGIQEFCSTRWQEESWDCVYSIDVFEHIERAEERDTLRMLARHFPRAFLVIDCSPAKKRLPDGRNAHVNLKTPQEWVELVDDYYAIASWQTTTDKHGRTRVCIVGTNL